MLLGELKLFQPPVTIRPHHQTMVRRRVNRQLSPPSGMVANLASGRISSRLNGCSSLVRALRRLEL